MYKVRLGYLNILIIEFYEFQLIFDTIVYSHHKGLTT